MKKIWIALALVVLFFVALVFVSFLFASPEDIGTEVPKKNDLELLIAQDPERGEVREVIVPERRVPKTFFERLRAPAIALLPNHLRAPEARSSPSVPAGDARAIRKVLNRFLPLYETYLPGEAYNSFWSNKWKKMVVAERLSDISGRLDSNDYPGVCPFGDCSVGSRWSGGKPVLFFVDYSGSRAYLSGYGSLLYRGDPRINPLAAGSTERAYGILMVKKGNSWFLERIAAESLR